MKTTIYIPDDQMAALDAIAKREARPKAQVIREALQRYVAENGSTLPQSRGILEDHEVDSTNIGDWLRENWHPE